MVSQKSKVLASLQSGKPLSTAQAAQRFGMPQASVAKRIYDLAQEGHRIVTGKNTYGVTTYTLVG
jgi:biotin operon repressor